MIACELSVITIEQYFWLLCVFLDFNKGDLKAQLSSKKTNKIRGETKHKNMYFKMKKTKKNKHLQCYRKIEKILKT